MSALDIIKNYEKNSQKELSKEDREKLRKIGQEQMEKYKIILHKHQKIEQTQKDEADDWLDSQLSSLEDEQKKGKIFLNDHSHSRKAFFEHHKSHHEHNKKMFLHNDIQDRFSHKESIQNPSELYNKIFMYANRMGIHQANEVYRDLLNFVNTGKLKIDSHSIYLEYAGKNYKILDKGVKTPYYDKLVTSRIH